MQVLHENRMTFSWAFHKIQASCPWCGPDWIPSKEGDMESLTPDSGRFESGVVFPHPLSDYWS
jgi:hypothetical protein